MAPTGKRAARLVCVFAVLIGLFGMHGLATAQTGGCHAGYGMVSAPSMTVAAPSMTTGSSTGDTVDAVAMMTAHRMADTMTGVSCLFVSPTVWPPLALVLLALVIAAAWPYASLRWPAWLAGRSPPRSGVSLLRRVCVSRT